MCPRPPCSPRRLEPGEIYRRTPPSDSCGRDLDHHLHIGAARCPNVDTMKGDGDGWAAGPAGAAMWGRNGAAGLLLLAGQATEEISEWQVLMQHRAHWTNNGGTWALPGGARDSHESVPEAALREAAEETGIDAGQVEILHSVVTAGPFPADPQRPELAGDWSYTTVIARSSSGEPLRTVANEESLELRWVRLAEVPELPLMAAFASAWPGLEELIGELNASV